MFSPPHWAILTHDGSTMLNAKSLLFMASVCTSQIYGSTHPSLGPFHSHTARPTSSSSCAALSLLSCLRLLGWAQGMAQGAATTPRGPRGRNSRARTRSPPCQPAPWSASPSPCIRRRASPSGPLLPLLVRDADGGDGLGRAFALRKPLAYRIQLALIAKGRQDARIKPSKSRAKLAAWLRDSVTCV